jgi:hypothetical protein
MRYTIEVLLIRFGFGFRKLNMGLLSQSSIYRICSRTRVYRNIPDVLAAVQFSAREAGDQKMGYGFVCGQNDLIRGAIPGGMDSRRFCLKAFRGMVAYQIVR